MKKYPTGFRPADFKLGSYIFLIVGSISLFLSFVSIIKSTISTPTFLFYFGIISITLGMYFAYIAKRDKKSKK